MMSMRFDCPHRPIKIAASCQNG